MGPTRGYVSIWLTRNISHSSQKHKDSTFWFEGPRQGGIPQTVVWGLRGFKSDMAQLRGLRPWVMNYLVTSLPLQVGHKLRVLSFNSSKA